MPVVWIPSLLRSLTGGADKVVVAGGTIGEVIDHLEGRFPGIRARLCDGNALRPGMAVAVNAQVARLGLAENVDVDSEIHFVPAVGGGSPATHGAAGV